MEFQRIWVLRGANIWARCPVLEVALDLADLAAISEQRLAVCAARLHSWLPSLATPSAGADLATLLSDLTLELQRLVGSDVQASFVRPPGVEPFFRIVIEFAEEKLGRACLETARQVILAAVQDRPFEVAAELSRLRDLANQVRLDSSAAAIVGAARRRGIPVRRINSDNLVQLGHGFRQRRICAAETDTTSTIAARTAQDKQLTRALLSDMGIPVPEGRPAADPDDAWRAAEEIGLPVVVKPRYSNHGRGVATNLRTREQVVRAYAAAREQGSQILVESHIPGADHRLLVIGDRLVAAARREPAHVIGDGCSTIRQLVAAINRDRRRSDGHATVLSFNKLDAVDLSVLSEQGYTPDSVPPASQRVLIGRNGNLSSGDTITDVTDLVYPKTVTHAVDAAHAVGLEIAGVDVVAADIGQPLEEQRGTVVKVNAGPGLRLHLEPSFGQPRPVGDAIVDLLFGAKQTGRIPLIAVTGVSGKTTTTRLLAHLLSHLHRCVGMSCTDGAYIDGRRIEAGDLSGPRGAHLVLGHPRVEAAVLETARGGILRRGLGFDSCDVAVVTNIGGGDHFDSHGVETVDDLARVKRTVVENVAANGVAVLNATDPLVANMAAHCPGRVLFFSRDAGHPVVAAHRARGERTVFVRAGQIVLAEGQREEVLTPLECVPMTHGGRVGFLIENVLAACAAVWSLKAPLDAVRAGLSSFHGGPQQVPGRFNVFHVSEATVIVDYAHNPSALNALVDSLDGFAHRRRCLVFSPPRERRNVDVLDMGHIIGDGFDRILLYHDEANRDAADEELFRLLRRGIATGKRVDQTMEVPSEQAAIETALAELRNEDLLVIGVESIEESLTFVASRLSASAAEG